MALTLVGGCTALEERSSGELERRGAGTEDTLVSRAVSRAQIGDGNAFEFLYARYADDVYGHVCSVIDDEREAAEVTQHVFAELTRRIGCYEGRDAFCEWTLRLAHEVAIHRVRRQRLVLVGGAKG
jgi:DNA-directed RNA polymerase specialized sigma24 family protein